MIKIRCACKTPNTRLFDSREFTVLTNARGEVSVDTTLSHHEWTSVDDSYQLVVFTRKKQSMGTAHKVVFEEYDLKVVELTSTIGRQYVVAVKPGGAKR
jgi:hypothetical protein